MIQCLGALARTLQPIDSKPLFSNSFLNLTGINGEYTNDKGAGRGLDKVERNDEFVVEHVQQGIKSSSYKAGRFTPTSEQGVHHLHNLLAKFLNRFHPYYL